jgi:hypothetical protein
MGRSSSKRKRQQAQQQATHNKNKSNNKKSKRKKKRDRFWVEDCQDTKIPEDRTADIDVLVTRVELEDSFWNAPDGPETTGPIGKSPKTHQTSAKGPDSGETRETSTKTDDPIGSPTTKETSDTSQEKQENSTESSTALVCVRKAENAKRPLQRVSCSYFLIILPDAKDEYHCSLKIVHSRMLSTFAFFLHDHNKYYVP